MRPTRTFVYFTLVLSAAALALGAKPITKKKTLIVAIGDSLTAGTPFFRSPLEDPPTGSGDPEGQFIHWMMRKKPNWEVLNMGVAGETSGQIHGRFPQAIASTPRFVIILAGTNDIYQHLPLASTTGNLLSMYQEAKTAGVVPVAVTLPPFNESTPEQTAAILKLNKWIVKQSDLMRIPLADAYQATIHPEDPSKLSGSPDGLHPDIGGYRSMALKMIEAIEPIERVWR